MLSVFLLERAHLCGAVSSQQPKRFYKKSKIFTHRAWYHYLRRNWVPCL